MVGIPEHGDPTLRALLLAVEKNQKFEDRDYIGASMIGDPCARKIWYKYNKCQKTANEWTAIGAMAAESGHYAEDVTAARLRMIDGIELHTHMENREQYGWETDEGKIQGHYDGLIRGILQAPRTIHIWEHKDKDHKKFANFQSIKAKVGKKATLKAWDEVYYGQAQVNMHNANIDGKPVTRHYMTVSYAGGRKYDSCRTNYNPEFAEQLMHRARRILGVSVPPPKMSEQKDFFLCRLCDYRGACHG